jgi:hypothetical protein
VPVAQREEEEEARRTALVSRCVTGRLQRSVAAECTVSVVLAHLADKIQELR